MKGQKIIINPDLDYSENWYREAKKQTVGTINSFVFSLISEFKHTPESKIWAATACAMASLHVFNKSKSGGFTEPETRNLLWEVYSAWSGVPNLCGYKLIDYKNMIFPSSQPDFEKTITRENFTALQEFAQNRIEGLEKDKADYVDKLKEYQVELANFIERHSDYHTNKNHYTRNRPEQNFQELAQDELRARKGFVFAPIEPKAPVEDKAIVDHWYSIVAGTVPFGYTIIEPEIAEVNNEGTKEQENGEEKK